MSDMIQNGHDGGSLFSGGSGRWAAERMLRAAQEGRPLNSQVLRTADALRHEEWKFFDQELVAEAMIQLHGVSDLISLGLTRTVPNSLGKSVFAYEKIGFMNPATVSLDGVTRTDNDRQEFQLAQLPLPIIHKDFSINLRTLMASRNGSEGLDTTQIRTAGRVVSEMQEQMLFQGSKTFQGMPIYGYTTEPNRNTMSFGTNGNWGNPAKTGADFIADTLAAITLLQAKRFNGPYYVYVGRDASVPLDNDFKAFGTLSIRQRLLQIDGVQSITVVDKLPNANVVVVNMSSDTVEWIQGEGLQTVQWDLDGGFKISFKAWTIGAPLVRSDIALRSGVVHMS